MPSINWVMYMATSSAADYGADAAGRAEVVRNMKSLGVTKVYMDVWRGGRHIDRDLLVSMRDTLTDAGIGVAAGIMPSRGAAEFGSNSRWGADLCYSDPGAWDDVRKAMETGAELFDEFIIDDAFCTQCTCTKCRSAKGDRSWNEFRRDLLLDFTKEVIVGAPRKRNPGVKMILKFPQWYDRLAIFGYDTARQPAEFEATWIGTETRDPETAAMGFVHQYEGCFNSRWHDAAEPNLEGAWFDPYDCDPILYVEQAYQSVLGGMRTLMLFEYGSLFPDQNGFLIATLKGHQESLEKLAARLDGQEPTGVVTVRPHNPEPAADGYIFDGLGMLGIPLVPVAEWPADPPEALLLTDHVADDPELAAKVRDVVDAGGNVFLTAGLVAARDADEELKKLAGFEADGWAQPIKWSSDRFQVGDKEVQAAQPVAFRFDLRPTSAEVLATVSGVAHKRSERIPVVTRLAHSSGGAVVVLNVFGVAVSDYTMEENLNVPIVMQMQYYPEAVANVIQEQVANATGRAFLAPAKVGYYPFSNGDVVLENFTDSAVTAHVAGEGLAPEASEILGMAGLKDGDVRLPSRSAALIGTWAGPRLARS